MTKVLVSRGREHTVVLDVLVRTGTVIVLCSAYVFVWQPIRSWTAVSVLGPVLGSINTVHASEYEVQGLRRPPSVTVTSIASGGKRVRYGVPAGIYFLLPAVILVAVAPRKPYWVWHGVFLLVLGLIAFAAVAIGIAWFSLGFVLHDFLSRYVIRVGSIGFPIFVFYSKILASPQESVTGPAVD